MKLYYTQNNIGTAKYTVNFTNGIETHNDNSPFYNIRIFHNAKKRNRFVSDLLKNGYHEK